MPSSEKQCSGAGGGGAGPWKCSQAMERGKRDRISFLNNPIAVWALNQDPSLISFLPLLSIHTSHSINSPIASVSEYEGGHLNKKLHTITVQTTQSHIA